MTVGLIAALLLLTALVSRKLVDGPVTPPAIFAAAGVAAAATGIIALDVETESVVLLAEATLTVILFVDAARIPLRSVRHFAGIPLRLLGIGLPLAIAIGAVVAHYVLGLEWATAVMLAAALGATDAALGRVVVSSPDLPPRISQSINVESGLNDGMAVPVITFAIGVAAAEAGAVSDLPLELVRQIGLGLIGGGAVGWVSGKLIRAARERDLVDGIFGQLGTVAAAGLSYVTAVALGGNGFIAAYVAGIAFGWVCGEQAEYLSEFSEDTGSLLNLVAFFIFGAVMLEPALGMLDLRLVLTAVVFLTVVRMTAVALALVGSKLRLPSVAYLGWFGPRGLASILFGFIFVEELEADLPFEVLTAIAVTVALSVLAHGASAKPLTATYSRWYQGHVQQHAQAVEGGMTTVERVLRTRR